jgi:hypothetical protein
MNTPANTAKTRLLTVLLLLGANISSKPAPWERSVDLVAVKTWPEDHQSHVLALGSVGDLLMVRFYQGFQAYDISDPAKPVATGLYSPEGGFVCAGDRLYTSELDGIHVYQVHGGSVDLLGSFKGLYNSGLWLNGTVLFVETPARIDCLDLSNPSQIRKVGEIPFDGTDPYIAPISATLVNFSYNTGFTAMNLVYNLLNSSVDFLPGLSQSAHPGVIGAQAGSIAYVFDEEYKTTLMDLSDPANPIILSKLDSTVDPRKVKVLGNIAYVLTASSGFQTFDVSDTSLPRELDQLANPPLAWGATYFPDFEIKDHYAFLPAGDGGLTQTRIVDISDPGDLGVLSTLDGRDGIPVGTNYAATINANISGFSLYDISDAAHPTRVSDVITFKDWWSTVAVQNQLAYVGQSNRLAIVDVRDPTLPIELGSTGLSISGDSDRTPAHIAVDGHYAIVSEYEQGIQLVDVSDPANPERKGRFRTSAPAEFSLLRGNIAYVFVNNIFQSTAIEILDISDPLQITRLSTFKTQNLSTERNLGLFGKYLLIEDWGSAFRVVDVSDPARPSEVASIESKEVYGFEMQGSIAYVVDGSILKVIDLTKLPAIDIVSEEHLADTYWPSPPVTLASDKLLIPVSTGTEIYDISNPRSPQFLWHFDVRVGFEAAENGLLYATAGAELLIRKLDIVAQMRDDFRDNNHAEWTHFDPFAPFGQAASFKVENGIYKLSSDPSPAPNVLSTTVGACHPDVNFSDSRQSIEVSGWRNTPEDAPVIALGARTVALPDNTFSWYSANFSPTPFSKPAGVPLSPFANFGITKAIKNQSTTLVITNFETLSFDPAKWYRIEFAVNGAELSARLFEVNGTNLTQLAAVEATDTTLTEGYCGFFTADKHGVLGTGNNEVAVAVDNYSASGVETGPRLGISSSGVLYWPLSAADYQLETSGEIAGSWAPATMGVTSTPFGLSLPIESIGQKTRQFYRLRKN